MSKRTYNRVQHLLPEIKELRGNGKTYREIAETLGLENKYVVKQLLLGEKRKAQKIEAGILPRPQGRPRKDTAPRDVVSEQAYEIARLKMENKLLRDFLQLSERR